jgi:hypothetical protein
MARITQGQSPSSTEDSGPSLMVVVTSSEPNEDYNGKVSGRLGDYKSIVSPLQDSVLKVLGRGQERAAK